MVASADVACGLTMVKWKLVKWRYCNWSNGGTAPTFLPSDSGQMAILQRVKWRYCAGASLARRVILAHGNGQK